jgi:hypothetical protein
MKSLSSRLLPFIAAGALSFSPEAVVKAQMPVEITRSTGSTGFKSEKDQPRKAERVQLKTPAEMIARRMDLEGGAELKINARRFSPAGLGEVERRLAALRERVASRGVIGDEQSTQPSAIPNATSKSESRAPVQFPYIGVEALLGPDYRELSPEFAWVADFAKKGLITGFSFVELRPGSVFNNNSIAYKPKANSPFYPKAEFGFANGKPFGSAGAEWNIKQTFPISKVFDAATVTYFHKLYGVTPTQQIAFFWDTKSVKAFGFDVDTQGFIRLRPGTRNR